LTTLIALVTKPQVVRAMKTEPLRAIAAEERRQRRQATRELRRRRKELCR
jgi:hypothetical protein